jgi:hypothetical protein
LLAFARDGELTWVYQFDRDVILARFTWSSHINKYSARREVDVAYKHYTLFMSERTINTPLTTSEMKAVNGTRIRKGSSSDHQIELLNAIRIIPIKSYFVEEKLSTCEKETTGRAVRHRFKKSETSSKKLAEIEALSVGPSTWCESIDQKIQELVGAHLDVESELEPNI